MFMQLPKIKSYYVVKREMPYLRIVTGLQVDSIDFNYAQFETISQIADMLSTIFNSVGFQNNIAVCFDQEKDNDLEVYFDGDMVISVTDRSLGD